MSFLQPAHLQASGKSLFALFPLYSAFASRSVQPRGLLRGQGIFPDPRFCAETGQFPGIVKENPHSSPLSLHPGLSLSLLGGSRSCQNAGSPGMKISSVV